MLEIVRIIIIIARKKCLREFLHNMRPVKHIVKKRVVI